MEAASKSGNTMLEALQSQIVTHQQALGVPAISTDKVTVDTFSIKCRNLDTTKRLSPVTKQIKIFYLQTDLGNSSIMSGDTGTKEGKPEGEGSSGSDTQSA